MKVNTNSHKAFLNRYDLDIKDEEKKLEDCDYSETHARFLFMNDLQKQKEAITCISDTTLVVIIIGLGNGVLVRNLRERITSKTRLIVWEPEWSTFLCACQMDLSDILLNEGIDFIVGKDEKAIGQFEKLLGTRLDYSNLYHCVILSMPGFQDIYQDYSIKVNEIFNKATFDLRIDVGTREYFAQHNCRNELFAMSIMHNNSLIDRLWEVIPTREIPVIIVASGPSLKKNVSLLKGLENKALILSAAHSASVLNEYGVPMHFAAMMDGLGGAHFMDYDTESKARMIMGASTIRFLQEKYNGNTVYFSFDQSLFPLSGIKGENYGYELGGSITTALLGMVRVAGFRKVILIGQDLAYDEEGVSHASGEREERSNDQWLEGINGNKVRVRNDWVLFLKSFENEIVNHPDLTVIDATEGGALIHGSHVMTFREAIDKYCNTEYPVQDWLDSIPKNGEQCRAEVEKIIGDHFSRILYTRKVLKEITEIGRYLLKQCENNTLSEKENASYCERYDHLYSEIIDNESDGLTMMYCDDIVQKYVIQAVSLEGDDIIEKRMRLELGLFQGMLDRDEELIDYLTDLFSIQHS